MRHDDIIAPIRTRGAIRVRGSTEEERVEPQPVRTRGAIRTRGAARKAAPELRVINRLKLDTLVTDLRKQIGDLPLTIILHGWGGLPAGKFLKILSQLLGRDDALWLIPSEELESPPSPPIEGAVLLDLNRDTDLRTCNNLVGDILFFPATEEGEPSGVAEWRKRAQAVIVDAEGSQCTAVLQRGCEAGLYMYRWTGSKDLEEYVLP